MYTEIQIKIEQNAKENKIEMDETNVNFCNDLVNVPFVVD